jgi:hypothetical protein
VPRSRRYGAFLMACILLPLGAFFMWSGWRDTNIWPLVKIQIATAMLGVSLILFWYSQH